MAIATKAKNLSGRLAALEIQALELSRKDKSPFAIFSDGLTDQQIKAEIKAFIDQHGVKPLVVRLSTWDDYPNHKRVTFTDEDLALPEPKKPEDVIKDMQEEVRKAAQRAAERGNTMVVIGG